MDSAILQTLGEELVHSPFLSIMVLNDCYEVVWHNQRFADEFSAGASLLGKHCYEIVGSETAHSNCPLQESMKEGKRIKGFMDFGDRNFLFFTVPIAEKLAAKIHIFLPKEADDQTIDLPLTKR